jgi:hypothetical protein
LNPSDDLAQREATSTRAKLAESLDVDDEASSTESMIETATELKSEGNTAFKVPFEAYLTSSPNACLSLPCLLHTVSLSSSNLLITLS